ncbi:Hypothetical protein CGLY_11080 [Corynebacterium glyciniphilum AJ 3170]|uniref:SnoaL-like domain-containing protein n=1 Tax=Corynebacterium glyciniphilum AJ 3170 TaxID=1404245 RepID=X5EDG8_9CORY|nr:nuclear transport factor 2 family protein [Corynebacterium glyciniphilum]AHW64661.1 Hypothetical protein CGLY_11080 [Corynebacterium glyciniphilum AJ 3170]
MIDTIERMFSKVGQLYGRQSFAIDEGDASAWARTFAPDGLFVSPSYPDPVSGREALETFARRIYTDSRAAGPLQRHVVTNPMVFRKDDGRWCARAYLSIVATGPDGIPTIVRVTTVEDELRVVGEQVDIARRTVRVDAGTTAGRGDGNDRNRKQ